MVCPDCKGKGHILLLITKEDPCETCEGTGVISESKTRRTCVSVSGQCEDSDSSGAMDWYNSGFAPWPYSVD
jgi:DnaJ-class molecular chaperone